MHIVTRALIAGLIIMVIAAISCNNEPAFELTGQWKYAAWQMGDRQVDLGALGTPIVDFNNDGSFKATLNGNVSNEKWQLKGDTLSLIYSDGNSQKFLMHIVSPDSIELVGDVGDIGTKLILVKTKQ